jgi:GTP:adenosylcobinamide-phosphate guanylyltransferase
LGDEEHVVGLSLLYETDESDEDFETRRKIYQINTFRKAKALETLSEQEERELYERLKKKYGDQ